MSVTVFRAPGFGGDFARLTPGLYANNDLVGCARGSTNCQPFDREIGSMRIDRNTVAIVSGSAAMRPPSRVLFGPTDLATLAPIGMEGRVTAITVLPWREYDSAIPAPLGGASIYDAPSFFGRRADLARGDYDAARLASTEVGMRVGDIGSVTVEAHCVLVLYADPADPAADAAVVVGPGAVEDLDLIGMAGRVTALKLIYTDPFDTPGRPRLGLGVARDYTPGAGLNPWGPQGPTTASGSGPRGTIGDVGRPVIGNWGQPPPALTGAGEYGAIESMRAQIETDYAERKQRAAAAAEAAVATTDNHNRVLAWFGLLLLLVIVALFFRRTAEKLGGGDGHATHDDSFPRTARGAAALATLSGF